MTRFIRKNSLYALVCLLGLLSLPYTTQAASDEPYQVDSTKADVKLEGLRPDQVQLGESAWPAVEDTNSTGSIIGPVESTNHLRIFKEGTKAKNTKIAPQYKDTTLNSDQVVVYDPNATGTWLPVEYQHYWDYSNASMTGFSNIAGQGVNVVGKGNLGTIYKLTGLPISRGVGATDVQTDFGIRVQNVSYAGIPIDIEFHVIGVEIANFDSSVSRTDFNNIQDLFMNGASGTPASDGTNGGNYISFRQQDGIYAFVFRVSRYISTMRYQISYYKAGTNEKIAVQTPQLYGDQEGAIISNSRTANGVANFPGNVNNDYYGETMQIIGGAAKPDQYPTFFLNAANGQPYNESAPIPDNGNRVTASQTGVFKTTLNSDPTTIAMYKVYGYQTGTNQWIWSDGGGGINPLNIDQFQPLAAQWSYLFNGDTTLVQEQGDTWTGKYLYAGQGTKAVTNDPVNNGYWNFIGYSSNVPGVSPKPQKWVSDTDEAMVTDDSLSSPDEGFKYTLEGNFPIQYYKEFNLKAWQLTDTIPPGLAVNTAGITAFTYDEQGKKGSDVSSNFTIAYNSSTRKLTIVAKATTLSDMDTYGKNAKVRFEIPVTISDITQVTKDDQGKVLIDNSFTQSGTYFDNMDFSDESNHVYTRVDWGKGITISKSLDKPLMETGKNDPADLTNGKTLQPLTYKISVTNQSAYSAESHVRILDRLPFDGDSRSTLLPENGKIVDAYILDDQGNKVQNSLYYQTNSSLITTPLLVDQDPNLLPTSSQDLAKLGWIKRDNWTSLPAGMADAGAFLADIASIPAKATYSLVIVVDYTSQVNPGALLHNNATANSDSEQLQVSNTVDSSIYGRNLSGFAWYDDNANGLADSDESRIADIPLKLYRTSLVNQQYINQLVTKSIDGQIDYSQIKTAADGSFVYKNLPEGTYTVAYQIGDQVTRKQYQVTKYLADSIDQDPNNSKVDSATYQVTGSPQAASAWSRTGVSLADIAKAVPKDGVQTMPWNNLGIIRSAILELFKYDAGSLIDSNGNGQYDDEELAAAKPVQGAVFEIYRGRLTDRPTQGANDPSYITQATTDQKGQLQVDRNLFMVEDSDGHYQSTTYTVFEVKAPQGYELSGKPYYFDVTKGNDVIKLYVDNQQESDLPATGGDGISLILFGSVMLLGFGVIVLTIALSYRNKTQG